MFEPDALYTKPLIAKKVRRCTRALDNWRKRGLLPPHDLLLGGKQPAWWGRTLNAAPAFRPEADADHAA